MATRVLINIDAEDVAAIKQVRKLRDELKRTAGDAKGIGKAMTNVTSGIANYATGIATVGTAIAALSGLWREHTAEIERARQAATQYRDRLNEALGGSGNLEAFPEMQEWLASRGERGAVTTTEQDIAAFNAFRGGAPDASIEQSQQAVRQAEQARMVLGQGADGFTGLMGGLVQAGVDQGRAGDVSLYLSQAAGGRAGAVQGVMTRAVSQLQGYGDDNAVQTLLPLLLANAKSQGSPEAVTTLLGQFMQNPSDYDNFGQWVAGVDTSELSTEARRQIGGIRDQLGNVDVSEGYLGQEAGQARANRGDQALGILNLRRRRQDMAAQNINQQERIELEQMRINLDADESGGFWGGAYRLFEAARQISNRINPITQVPTLAGDVYDFVAGNDNEAVDALGQGLRFGNDDGAPRAAAETNVLLRDIRDALLRTSAARKSTTIHREAGE